MKNTDFSDWDRHCRALIERIFNSASRCHENTAVFDKSFFFHKTSHIHISLSLQCKQLLYVQWNEHKRLMMISAEKAFWECHNHFTAVDHRQNTTYLTLQW